MSQNLSSSGVYHSNIPQSGISQFVGREQELETLHQCLQTYNQVAIAGIAGIGKTELAIQYAKANLNYYTGGVCWLFARSDLGLHIVEFARTHFSNFTIPNQLTPDTQVRYCWQYWTPPQGEVLIIIDNLTNYAQIQSYLPLPSSRFKVLITTRLQLEQPIQVLALDVLTPPAALDLLASRIGKYRVNNTRGKPFKINSKSKSFNQKKTTFPSPYKAGEVALQLCESLGYLPLGIELLGSYLKQKRNLSLETMRSRLQKQFIPHLSLVQQNDNIIQNRVKAAFELSWQHLDEEVQLLGCLLSIFALAPIPWTQVESVYGQLYLPGALLGKLLDTTRKDSETEIENLIKALLKNLNDAKAQLEQHHLLQHIGNESYQLHPLIWEWLQAKQQELEKIQDLKQAFCQVMLAVAKQIPNSPSRDLIEAVTPAIPHVAQAAMLHREFISDEDVIVILDGLSWFYQSQGFYDQAAPWREQSLQFIQTRLGVNHLDVATQLHSLAWIYYAQERYREAEPLSIQALKICEKHLGCEHPFTIFTRKNLDILQTVLNPD